MAKSMQFADAGQMDDHPYFEDPNRQRFDFQWRAEHANRHRPSACGGLGKALARIRRPSSGFLGIREFNHSQALRVPPVEDPNFEEEDSVPIWDYSPQDDGAYCLKTIIGDEGVLLGLSEQGEIIWAGWE